MAWSHNVRCTFARGRNVSFSRPASKPRPFVKDVSLAFNFDMDTYMSSHDSKATKMPRPRRILCQGL